MPVLSVTVITVPEGPTFAMKLDREENLTVLESGVRTAADKSRKKDNQRWNKFLKDQHEAVFHNCFLRVRSSGMIRIKDNSDP